MDVDLDSDSGPDLLGPSDPEDDDALVLTPKEVLDRLEAGWLNEKMSPDLLPPLTEEKNAMLSQISVMERNIGNLDKKDMRTDVHRLELERIKFIVKAYMRTRLFKIQEKERFYYEEELKRSRTKQSRLTPEEFAFVKGLSQRTENYLKATVLEKMPVPLQIFEGKKFQKSPHIHAHVFFRAKEDADLEVEDSHERIHQVKIQKGEQHIMRYEPIANLLHNDKIYLV